MVRPSTVLPLVLFLVSGCATAPAPKPMTAEERAAFELEQATRQVEMARKVREAEEVRLVDVARWQSENPGRPVPYRLAPTPRLVGRRGDSKERRFKVLSDYFATRVGFPEEDVISQPPMLNCKMDQMKGRKYVKTCEFFYNYPDEHPENRIKMRFEDGKLADWDFD